MSRRAVYHISHRVVIAESQIDQVRSICSPTGRFTWFAVGRLQERLRVHTLHGVPGKHVDVLLPEQPIEGHPIVEVGHKIGSYDGAERWRITIRSWPHISDPGKPPSITYPGNGKLVIEEETDSLHCLLLQGASLLWAKAFPQLRFEVRPGELERIVFHHWTNYYHFLPEDDVRASAAFWAELEHTKSCRDIVQLNRSASNLLYDLARQLGWRKLTLREKRRLGLAEDSPQWQRAERCAYLAERAGSRTGCGEYTLDAAAGEAISLPSVVCPHCWELASSCVCASAAID